MPDEPITTAADPGAGAAVAAAPESAPAPPVETTPVVDMEADAFRRAMGLPQDEPAATPGAQEPSAPEQQELALSEESFAELLNKELPVPDAPAPDAAVKPEGLSDDDWTDLQLLKAMRSGDESTTQQLAEARAKILGDMPQFEVTEEAFKAALDGDAATFSQVVNETVRTGAEHAVQAMLGQVAPVMEAIQAQYSTMIYANMKELFLSTVPGADKMRGNQYFDQAIAHVAKAAPDTGIVQALHRAMELTNKAYADTTAVAKGAGRVVDVRPAGIGGVGVQPGVRGAAAPAAPDPMDVLMAQAWGVKPNA